MSDLVPFHSGQFRNFCLLVLGQVKIVSNIINFLKAHFGYRENSVDPDQQASSTYSSLCYVA